MPPSPWPWGRGICSFVHLVSLEGRDNQDQPPATMMSAVWEPQSSGSPDLPLVEDSPVLHLFRGFLGEAASQTGPSPPFVCGLAPASPCSCVYPVLAAVEATLQQSPPAVPGAPCCLWARCPTSGLPGSVGMWGAPPSGRDQQEHRRPWQPPPCWTLRVTGVRLWPECPLQPKTRQADAIMHPVLQPQ